MYVMHEKMFRASLEAGNMPPVGLVQTTLSMRDFDCTLSVCHNDDCVKSNHPEESKVLNHAAYPFRFFKASGLFEITIPTVWHISSSGQSPHVVTPFFNAH